jgi:hypothetical protein
MNLFLRSFLILLLLISFNTYSQENIIGLRSFDSNQTLNKSGEDRYTNYALPDNGGTSGNSRAPQGSQRYIRTVYLVTQAELSAAGIPANVSFNSIGFVYSTAQSISTTGNFKVYFQNTSNSVYGKPSDVWTNGTNGIIDEMTLADSGIITIPAALGGFDYIFTTQNAFTYTGGGLYIAFEYQNPAGTLSTSNVASCNSSLAGALKNAFSLTALPASVGATASAFRPGTRLGYVMNNDAAVVNVYTMGKLPLVFGVPHTISAVLRNTGDDAIASIPCTLKVTGSNTYTNIKTVALPVGSTIRVNFDAYRPANTGVDTLTVTIADGNNLNNLYSTTHTVNNNYTFAYSDGSNTMFNALGFNANGSGSFASKFYVNGHSKLNSAKVFIYAGMGKTVRGVAISKTGTVLAQSADYILQPSDSLAYVTFTFPEPPEITNDSVYVGLWTSASTTAYYPLGMQREVPQRAGAFFIIGNTGTITDVSQYGYGKFMIEAVFSQNPFGELLFSETFNNYTNGTLAGQNGWIKSGSGTVEAAVNNIDSLNYQGYDFGGGSYINFTTNSASSSRIYKDFADTSYSMSTPGVVAYYSVLVNLNTTYPTATGGYFLALGSAPATTNYFARLFAQKLTDSTFNLGISKSSNTPSLSSKVLSTNQTHLVIVRYNVNNTGLNQSGNTMYLWINPENGNEPDTSLADAKVYAGQLDYTSTHISSIAWHNRNATNPLGSIDGIRVAASPNSSTAAWTALAPGAIPVEMISFTSAVSDGKIILSWTTATEMNNNGFEVERKNSNSNTWETLGFVKGNGNSLSPINYSFIDQTTSAGRFSYRLKQVDYDGTYEYSSIINAEIGTPSSFSISQNYPNPFNPSTKIDYQVASDSRVKIELFSITGQKVADLVNSDLSAGFYSVSVNASSFANIASGVYVYKMTAIDKADGKAFITSKKMMLMK